MGNLRHANQLALGPIREAARLRSAGERFAELAQQAGSFGWNGYAEMQEVLRLERAIALSDCLRQAMFRETLLGIKHDGDTNPFLTDDDKSGTDGGVWGDLARAALARLDLEPTRGASVAPDETGEFIALKDWIARRFHPRRMHSNEFTERELVELQASSYSQKIEKDFGFTVGWVCEKVYHGIPLYERDPTGSYVPIPFNHEDYIICPRRASTSTGDPKARTRIGQSDIF